MWGSSSWLVGRGVALAFGALILGGCGSSASDSGAHSGAGGLSDSGDAGAGGASARANMAGAATAGAATAGSATAGADAAGGTVGASGASGGSAGLLLGDSPTEACIAYVVAQCLRRQECQGDPSSIQSCLLNASACPDLMFSNGSTRTVSSLKACTAEFATYSCEQLNLGFVPDCTSAGTRAPGQACAFNSQCASLSCDRPNQCGQCASLGELDADCSGVGMACKPGLSCDRSTKRCATYVYTSPDDPRFAKGMACTPQTGCNAGLYCAATGVCALKPTVGTSCADAPSCGDDSYCALADNFCTALPGFGAPCGMGTGGDSFCPSGAACWLFDTSWTCMPLGGSGTTCQLEEQCQAGLSCACADGTSDCAKRSCVTLGLTNAVCGVAGAACHPSFTCTAGKCQPRASQGLFDAACPGN